MMEFAWDDWNLQHIARHGVSPADAEEVVRQRKPPYPLERDGGKFLVVGRTRSGHVLQVVYALKVLDQVQAKSLDLLFLDDQACVAYVIHAMYQPPSSAGATGDEDDETEAPHSCRGRFCAR